MFALAFSLSLVLGCASAPKLSFPTFEKDVFIGTISVERSFGHFTSASALSFDAFGDLYVSDDGGNGLYKFTRKGDSLHALIGGGQGHGQFYRPMDVDASLTNSVAVADRNNYRIEIFSRDLIWQNTIEGHSTGSQIQFGYPSEIRRGATGYYYVLDGERHRVLAFNPASGAQKTLASTTGEHGYDIFPRSFAIDGGEYIDIADVNSTSLISLNNTGTIVKKVRYRPAGEARITCDGDELVAFDNASNTIRLFDFRELTYSGSFSLPKQISDAVMVVRRDDLFYILTKDKVVVCSITLSDDQ